MGGGRKRKREIDRHTARHIIRQMTVFTWRRFGCEKKVYIWSHQERSWGKQPFES